VAESVTVTEMADSPAAAGVPVIDPLAPSKLRPAGSVPDIVYVWSPVPPLETTCPV
jgi:hypothetical protein